jgi:hypothetical protein
VKMVSMARGFGKTSLLANMLADGNVETTKEMIRAMSNVELCNLRALVDWIENYEPLEDVKSE